MLLATREASAQTERDTVEAMNNRIVSNENYELFDRQFNAIELGRLNAGFMYYPIDHQQAIESIATFGSSIRWPGIPLARHSGGPAFRRSAVRLSPRDGLQGKSDAGTV